MKFKKQTEVITLFEDKKTKINLSKNQIDDLLYLKKLIGQQNLIIEYDNSIQIRHYVGFFSKGNTRIQILPKIYENVENKEEEISGSTKVLFNMLRLSEYNKVLNLPNRIETNLSDMDILELFIGIYADQIINTYSRNMNREYIDFEENSSFVKGKISFADTIKKNVYRKDLHYIQYQSFEHDNLINNVIKSVAVFLINKTNVSDNKKKLKKALVFLDDAREISLSQSIIDSVKFTRLNEGFKTVFTMAKMFFVNSQPDHFIGEEPVFSFLIPVYDLFEHYVANLLKLDKSFNIIHGTKRNFVVTTSKKTFASIKPDILVYQNNEVAYVLDTKYKNPKYVNGAFTKISSSDLYQIFSYSRIYGVNKIALIYPQFDDLDTESCTLNALDYKENVKLSILSVDLKEFDFLKVRDKLINDILT